MGSQTVWDPTRSREIPNSLGGPGSVPDRSRTTQTVWDRTRRSRIDPGPPKRFGIPRYRVGSLGPKMLKNYSIGLPHADPARPAADTPGRPPTPPRPADRRSRVEPRRHGKLKTVRKVDHHTRAHAARKQAGARGRKRHASRRAPAGTSADPPGGDETMRLRGSHGKSFAPKISPGDQF